MEGGGGGRKKERMKNKEEKNERGQERETGLCPGLPSPCGVHLVTHPLHRTVHD